MKNNIKLLSMSFYKLTFIALIVLVNSCSQDMAQELETSVDYSLTHLKSDLKTLVNGAVLDGANGVDIGPNGNLFVASFYGQEIVVLDKNNGKIIERFGPEDGVLGPDDLVFGPDGTLYWTDILTGFVGRMTVEGQQLGYQFVAPGVNPIRFSDDGRLFVGIDFLGDGLFELDPNLVEPPRHIISCPEGFCLGFFNSFDIREEQGRLYIYGPLFAANLVIAIDVTEETSTIFPTFPEVLSDPSVRIVAGLDGEFENPVAAKFGPDGKLYVLDQAGGEVWKVNPNGLDDKTLFTTIEPGLDNMVFDDDGSLYITNADEGWVVEILPSGQSRTISRGGMIAPQGIAVITGPNGKDVVFEADIFNIREFNGTNGHQENIYKGYLVPVAPDVGLASLILPMNLSVDVDNLVISSWFSAAVQVWNPEQGVIENYPNLPVPIDAVRVNGEIVVSDFELGGVVYASNNAMIAPLTASGLATDGQILWAADWATGEIWQIDNIGSTPSTNIIASGLINPEGLALYTDGSLLVIESGASRLTRIDLSTGVKTIITEGLELNTGGLGEPPTWGFDGVAVGSSGDIYISGGGKNVIYRIPQNKAF